MSDKVKYLTRLSLFSAIIILMAFTPIGYLHIGTIDITFIIIPVSVGAMLLGPLAGAILGGVFGVTSFIQCFGMSNFGVMLLNVNPIFTAILCLIPRILCGWLTGLVFLLLRKRHEKNLLPNVVGGLLTPILNTILFTLGFITLFRGTALNMQTEAGLPLLPFLAGFVGLNGIVEAGVGFALSVPISKALMGLLKNNKKEPF